MYRTMVILVLMTRAWARSGSLAGVASCIVFISLRGGGAFASRDFKDGLWEWANARHQEWIKCVLHFLLSTCVHVLWHGLARALVMSPARLAGILYLGFPFGWVSLHFNNSRCIAMFVLFITVPGVKHIFCPEFASKYFGSNVLL